MTEVPVKRKRVMLKASYAANGRGTIHITTDSRALDDSGRDLEEVFANDYDRLPNENFLQWLNRNGFAMNHECRRTLLSAKIEKEQAERRRREDEERQQRLEAEMEAMNIALTMSNRKTASVYPPVDMPEPALPAEALELTEFERQVFGPGLTGYAEVEPPPFEEEDSDAPVIQRNAKRKGK